MKITYTKRFVSKYKKLPRNLKLLFERAERIFLKDEFDPRLKTHALTGKLKNYWSFSVDYKHRVIFKLEDKKSAWFLSIGTHDVYRG